MNWRIYEHARDTNVTTRIVKAKTDSLLAGVAALPCSQHHMSNVTAGPKISTWKGSQFRHFGVMEVDQFDGSAHIIKEMRLSLC